MKTLKLLLPQRDIDSLKENNLIAHPHAVLSSKDENASLSRALNWMAKCDCAMLSAWRNGSTRSENNEKTKELAAMLRKYGYGFSKMRGCYPEVGQPSKKENSFFIINKGAATKQFRDDMFMLSEKFEQDSYLFKPAGLSETAYLVGTNDLFGKNKYIKLGRLHIADVNAEAYSRIGSGKIIFGD